MYYGINYNCQVLKMTLEKFQTNLINLRKELNFVREYFKEELDLAEGGRLYAVKLNPINFMRGLEIELKGLHSDIQIYADNESLSVPIYVDKIIQDFATGKLKKYRSNFVQECIKDVYDSSIRVSKNYDWDEVTEQIKIV